jgi:hypothetical protein
MVMSYSDQGLPYKTKFLCRGISLNERVQAQCFRMISGDNEKEISAQLLNPDGTAGLLGEVDDRKEEAMTQILSQDFVRGILGASKERVMTGLGEVTKTNFKNQMLGGAIEATEKSSELFAEDYKNLPVIIILNAGMEVLIYFNEGVNQ